MLLDHLGLVLVLGQELVVWRRLLELGLEQVAWHRQQEPELGLVVLHLRLVRVLEQEAWRQQLVLEPEPELVV